MPCQTDPSPRDHALRVVLDTNVVLDWLFFEDPACRTLAGAIESGSLHWIVTDALDDEMRHVLARPPFEARPGAAGRVQAAWQRWAVALPHPPALGPARRLVCSDPADQKFIDLAVAAGAAWLLSRDRALLKLARRARPLGVDVLSPREWRPRLFAG